MNDNLGDRIKGYEKTFKQTALKRTPLMIRVDGRAFHTFTKNLSRPFDNDFISAMVKAATETCLEMQGFKTAYVQSDEATFCITDYDTINSQGWFGYEIQKIISISAALMSVNFIQNFKTKQDIKTLPVFDSRAFNIPKEDVINAFLWRAKDWERNSLQMYCRSFFSHKELQGKKKADMHEMLHKIEKNWSNDLTDRQKNGTFIINKDSRIEIFDNIQPDYETINKEIGDLFAWREK